MLLKNPLGTSAIWLILLLASTSGADALSKKQSEEAGAALFRDKGCAYCHGVAALGTPKGPSLKKVRKTMTAAQIQDQIVNGGQKMPSFKDSLSQDEVSQLVQFLRAKHRPSPPPPANPAP